MARPTISRDALTTRPAVDADLAFCWRLHLALRAYVEATWGWDEDDQRRRFSEWFNCAPLSIVEFAAQPVGMLRVELDTDPVRLLNLAVTPDLQRRGIGTAVIEGVVCQAFPRAVSLQVLKANPARSLYERLGFEVSGESDTHWLMLRMPRAESCV